MYLMLKNEGAKNCDFKMLIRSYCWGHSFNLSNTYKYFVSFILSKLFPILPKWQNANGNRTHPLIITVLLT